MTFNFLSSPELIKVVLFSIVTIAFKFIPGSWNKNDLIVYITIGLTLFQSLISPALEAEKNESSENLNNVVTASLWLLDIVILGVSDA